MAMMNKNLSDQDGVLVGHNFYALSSEKKI